MSQPAHGRSQVLKTYLVKPSSLVWAIRHSCKVPPTQLSGKRGVLRSLPQIHGKNLLHELLAIQNQEGLAMGQPGYGALIIFFGENCLQLKRETRRENIQERQPRMMTVKSPLTTSGNVLGVLPLTGLDEKSPLSASSE